MPGLKRVAKRSIGRANLAHEVFTPLVGGDLSSNIRLRIFMAKIAKNLDNKPSHHEITERARQIYEQSGRLPGRDLENWLAAEEQLLAKRTPTANPAAEPRPTRAKTAPVATAPSTNRRVTF